MSQAEQDSVDPWWQRASASSRTTADGVRGHLKAMIHGGHLRPGDRLPAERQLSEMLSVSRSTLREGLSALRSEGYVEVRRGVEGGTFVAALDEPYARWLAMMASHPEKLREIIDVRTAVESHIASLAAVRRTDDQLADMSRALTFDGQQMNPREFRESDSRFHGLLAEAADSPRLRELMESARGELFTPSSEPLILASIISRSHAEHLAILQAIETGDGDLAARRMREHLEATFADVANAVAQANPVQAS